MSECLFCGIAAGEVAAEVLLRTDAVVAFRDVKPQAPVHVLVIPRTHIASAQDLAAGDTELLAALFAATRRVAEQEGLVEPGYRVVTNIGRDGGQTVGHLHLHVLGGRAMHWPPG